ncbi:hypothetical protein FIBSPDRAFT_244704 [Athelia psychrophila]|uniref:Uncharacterized protein n=1 Tax=Athelia psychrophila TaxID=1759441 RepID=A0A166RSF3_9AGAM|nr:hypothetical protein FIBSPDRAFT_244704 [Fibularhizoctonia sp. CBS 109695]
MQIDFMEQRTIHNERRYRLGVEALRGMPQGHRIADRRPGRLVDLQTQSRKQERAVACSSRQDRVRPADGRFGPVDPRKRSDRFYGSGCFHAKSQRTNRMQGCGPEPPGSHDSRAGIQKGDVRCSVTCWSGTAISGSQPQGDVRVSGGGMRSALCSHAVGAYLSVRISLYLHPEELLVLPADSQRTAVVC